MKEFTYLNACHPDVDTPAYSWYIKDQSGKIIAHYLSEEDAKCICEMVNKFPNALQLLTEIDDATNNGLTLMNDKLLYEIQSMLGRLPDYLKNPSKEYMERLK
jgi:hypothetical protein